MTGIEIRAIRKKTGLTQTEFAQVVGVHVVTLSRWENAEDPKMRQWHLAVLRACNEPEKHDEEALRRALYLRGPLVALYLILKRGLETAGGVVLED